MAQRFFEAVLQQFPVGSLIRNRPEVLYSMPNHDCDMLNADHAHIVVDVVDGGFFMKLVTQPRDYVRLYPGAPMGVERLDPPTT